MTRVAPASVPTTADALAPFSPDLRDLPAVRLQPLDGQRPPRKRPSKRHFYAIRATEHEITLPPHVPLGYLTQARLIQRAQAGDTEAGQKVWLANARLAYSIANRVRVRPHIMADIVQEAQLALPRAIRRFDIKRMLEFSTYAFTAMRRQVTRNARRLRYRGDVPATIAGDYEAFRHRMAEIHTRAGWFDLRDEYLSRSASLYHRLILVHAVIEAEPVEAAAGEPRPYAEPWAPLLAEDLQESLSLALASLNWRQRMVLVRRYGLDDQEESTLLDIGSDLGLTKERVRQIQVAAEQSLLQALTACGWDRLPDDPLALRVP